MSRWGAIPAAWIRGGTSKGALAALQDMIFDALLASLSRKLATQKIQAPGVCHKNLKSTVAASDQAFSLRAATYRLVVLKEIG